MKTTLILTTALVASGFAASAQELNVVSWGGSYTKSQVEAYHKPFTEMTGIKINSIDADNPATPLKTQVEAGNVTIDLADIELSDAIRLCDEGLLEPIDPASLPPAPDGTPAIEDFVDGALQDCAVATIVWGTIYAYDTTKFTGEKPSKIGDFFDTEKFPGKRGLLKAPKRSLEMALLADGVPAAEVYDVLGTPEGVDRAFAKLDTIKNDVVWWEAGAQPPQLLADGEVVMTTAYNGRIFNAIADEGKPFQIVWDGQYIDFDLWAIPKGAPNLEAAKQFLAFSTDTQRLADQAKWIAYGPARKSSASLVGLYQDGKIEMAPHMPTNPDNMTNSLVNDPEFWADHDVELNERFNAWLAG
ncbi:spermidine/putrescine ABC transporter substrate-binding protein [Rhodobacter veldkampii DSM 11550]|uniref:Spermidine/putrescine ABC transporter substrate-binding protein n=1 Tax=Phaeovulum veldkampii DSM 11550 TaxID=1185920 RepID=A0A2T4JHK0_9RHOB|nr:ABC transporter substrate-binding protein [Phaeovulum veldkampii]MBK5946215.1 spermidine/putrescine ABC transporter substrate-binding protein [Phaeovulum veldkampii DSM 11550]NCU20312.1 ABC transporter substrate-binding protein [Candidatus Falkowbacteria bacterium]PTE17394.1 spermidine/putrescine ABC transporter substrate-binding protein [Phaeovulum veldkampii DSM 11550]TDQ56608.1 putative spermidine/putrescine transport system substrate-binding protein [Phaeovulum veldkampii DSM 11550]